MNKQRPLGLKEIFDVYTPVKSYPSQAKKEGSDSSSFVLFPLVSKLNEVVLIHNHFEELCIIELSKITPVLVITLILFILFLI